MHNVFDQLVKLLSEAFFSLGGVVGTEVEVLPDSMRVDVWFTPDVTRAAAAFAPLGMLGRMALPGCTIESYHRTPGGEQLSDCLVKHRLFCRDLRRRGWAFARPVQWVVSSGRPAGALRGWSFRASSFGRGVYDGPELSYTRVVVVSELPRTRDTLLVRLMGAGRTLKKAIADLAALPADAIERRLALPILVRLRLELQGAPRRLTDTEEEFLMTTADVNQYLADIERKGREEGRKEGREEARVEMMLFLYETRFGAPPKAIAAALRRTYDTAAVQRLTALIASGSAEDVARALRPAGDSSPRSTPKLRSRASRRPPGSSR